MMAISEEIYRQFEAVVGPKNISRDIGILETYRAVPAQMSSHYGPYWKHMTPLPLAVILPGSTEEVQGIVRICNKFKIKFKAGGSFWGAMAYIGSDNAVQLDMRRMRNIDIDQKNQIALIEPYVNGVMLQAEAMKVGLNCNIPGVGCSSSIIASATGWVGAGPSSVSHGGHKDNVLALEWVLPNGEIMRTGSAGAGDDWFCGEGPGPSMRGILFGGFGSCGEMGVCTKMAIKLHPWPGPAVLPTYGTVPVYKVDLPDNFRSYTLCFVSWDAWAKAVDRCWETDVCYLGHRQFNMFGRELKGAMIHILNDPDKQLCDISDLLLDPQVVRQTEEMKIEFQIVIAGMTRRDMEYKEMVIDEILRECGGWKSSMMLESEIEKWTLLYLIRMGHKNLNFAMCGAYEGNFGLSTNLFVSAPLMEEAAALKLKWEKESTAVAATGGDSEMASLSMIGGGGLIGWEFFANFDAYEEESVKGTSAYFDDSQKWMFEKKLGPDMGRINADLRLPSGYDVPQEMHNEWYSKTPQPDIFAYQWKVRETVNPNHLSGSYYRTLDPNMLRG